LQRGTYGTSVAAHASGAPFARLDSAIAVYDLPTNYVGVKIYFKFQSFNVFGAGVESLSDCVAYPYTPSGIGGLPGPITAQLASGAALDLGSVAAIPALSDDFGAVGTGAILGALDLGLA
jgi:hypothetical protein